MFYGLDVSKDKFGIDDVNVGLRVNRGIVVS